MFLATVLSSGYGYSDMSDRDGWWFDNELKNLNNILNQKDTFIVS